MGRIADIVPPLYHGKDNNLIPFVDALDVEVALLERKVRGFTDLINIDKCPEDKLPYIAALINCPLIGDDPVFWRRQIRNWPYILKLKGTERSLELVLDSIGADDWAIKTFFRDAGGGYVTTKPTGQPFKDGSGLWHNIRTHYFGVEFSLSKAFVEAQDYNWDVEDIEEKMRLWFEHGKPYHAELLNMIILPPKFIDDDHICRWDVCNWEHIKLKVYDWGMLSPKPSIFETIPVLRRDFERKDFTISDTAFWGVNRWDCVPFRLLLTGQHSETGITVALEWGDGDAAMLFPNLWDHSQWDYVSTLSRSFGQQSTYGFFSLIDWENSKPQFLVSTPVRGFLSGLWPYWDCLTWPEHYSWAEEFEQQPVRLSTLSELSATLDWDATREQQYFFFDKDNWDGQEREKYDAPLPKWSKFKTWAGSDTWNITTEQSATWNVGSWTLQEE